MRGGRLWFGFFLVVVGLVLALQRLGFLPSFSLWCLFRNLWPLFLILMGLSLLLNRGNLASVIIIFLLLVLGLGIGLAWCGVTDWSWDPPRQGREEIIRPGRFRRFAIPWEEALADLTVEGEPAAGRSAGGWAAAPAENN